MKKVEGVYTALITPFNEDLSLNEEGLRSNLQHQIASGIDGIVPLGTTGECPTLSGDEKLRIISICMEEANGEIPVMVGTGSYSTQQAIADTLIAEELGADLALIVTPYYNKPTQEGLYLHFKKIASETNLPFVLYNIAGRTGQNLDIDTLIRLMEIPTIVGIKEASGNINHILDVAQVVHKYRPEFSIMSGDDALTLPMMSIGGDGIISVVSNLIPVQMKLLTQTLKKHDYMSARELHYALMPLFKSAFIETNPIPIKAMLNHIGMPAGLCRLPLCSLLPENLKEIQEVLAQYNDISRYNLAAK